MTDSYKTILKEGQAEYKDRGSRFIAIAFPLNGTDEFKKRLAEIKAEHPKANHHCFAYRIGIDGNTFRVGDDGEPSGSAGRPILGQLDSMQITNTAVVVVRYFGGTLLGVPGLINAYKMAAAFALQMCPLVEKPVEVNYKVNCTYNDLNEVMRIVKLCNGNVLTNDQGLFCTLTISIPKNRSEQAVTLIGKLYQVECKPL
jgi:uncharacterized YigZ family protein